MSAEGMTTAVAAVESEERKDSKPRVTILQLISVPSVAVLLVASLFAAASLTFLDPLLGELCLIPCMCPNHVKHKEAGKRAGYLAT